MIESGGFQVEIKSVADKALMPPMARPIVAGVAQPVVDRRGKYAARNERVEIVFVTPRP